MALPVLLGRFVSHQFASKMSIYWAKMNLFGLRVICGVTWRVEGAENIPDYPCVVMSKHQSTWDTYFIPSMLKTTAVYVAKRSLRFIPIFGWALIALNFILIDRKSGTSAIAQMVEQSKERFDDGVSVIIFPEGTRVPVGAKPAYRIGGARVAEHTGADVLPVALNAGEFWPRMKFIKWPGEITVIYGPVIKSEGKNAEQILAETEGWIESQMARITQLDRFPY